MKNAALLSLMACTLSACCLSKNCGDKKSLSHNSNKHTHSNNDPTTQIPRPNLPPFKVYRPTAAQQAEIDKAVAHTNKLRQEKGLPALQYDASLSAHAQKRAEELARKFSHTRPNGESWRTGIKGSYSGENIAAGHATADITILQQWRNSQGHYENMVRSGYTRIGIGFVYIPNSKYKYYWVQIFGNDNVSSDYSFHDDKSARSTPLVPAQNLPSSPIDTLNIDGHVLSLAPSEHADWHTIDTQGYTGVFGGNTVASRYGIVKADGENQYRTFYQGLPTPLAHMPQSGKVHYHGKAVAANGMEKHYLQADFTAHFDRKTLNGKLSGAQQSFDFNAAIRGNLFNTSTDDTVSIQGGFFGNNADEVSGVFDNGQGTHGAFGATRR